ncbi:MAG: hypothetical protein MUF78_02470 [Candidatus Edwardsbacteria bacterium]|nr:hypothetical protein [Candidatus Edwardsbacteria bacterium]
MMASSRSCSTGCERTTICWSRVKKSMLSAVMLMSLYPTRACPTSRIRFRSTW